MVNNYEEPELFELAKPKEVILGLKGCCNADPETAEFDFDDAVEEQFM